MCDSRTPVYFGIDVGFKGMAICRSDEKSSTSHAHQFYDNTLTGDDQLDIGKMMKFLVVENSFKVRGVLLEDVHAFPKQGAISAFKFAYAKGLVIGLCKALGYETIMVSPQAWKKELGLIGKDKKESISKAKSLLPEDDKKLVEKNHNNAEALLLCWYLYTGSYIKNNYKGVY